MNTEVIGARKNPANNTPIPTSAYDI